MELHLLLKVGPCPGSFPDMELSVSPPSSSLLQRKTVPQCGLKNPRSHLRGRRGPPKHETKELRSAKYSHRDFQTLVMCTCCVCGGPFLGEMNPPPPTELDIRMPARSQHFNQGGLDLVWRAQGRTQTGRPTGSAASRRAHYSSPGPA